MQYSLRVVLISLRDWKGWIEIINNNHETDTLLFFFSYFRISQDHVMFSSPAPGPIQFLSILLHSSLSPFIQTSHHFFDTLLEKNWDSTTPQVFNFFIDSHLSGACLAFAKNVLRIVDNLIALQYCTPLALSPVI